MRPTLPLHSTESQISNLKALDAKFRVSYPSTLHATYSSKVNYSQGLSEPFQKWCNYKEGYSISLNEEIFTRNALVKNQANVVILDPFSGSGTTPLAAKNWGFEAIGFEVNPFSHLYSLVKTRNYNDADRADLKALIANVRKLLATPSHDKLLELPELGMAPKVFSAPVLAALHAVKEVNCQVQNPKIYDLAKFAWIANLEKLSAYRKAGNGLKKIKKNRVDNFNEAVTSILDTLDVIEQDLELFRLEGPEPRLELSSSQSFDFVSDNSIDGIIFSPPYANCFDYSEIYKLELWFGEFVQTRDDLKRLRQASLTSHLNKKNESIEYPDEIQHYLDVLSEVELWDKRIPQMLKGYFEEMERVLAESLRTLKPNGFCSIVVSNSNYGGVVIPTDLLLSEIAQRLGFIVRELEVVRWVITSSQQYEKTLPLRKFIRETIVHLQKEA